VELGLRKSLKIFAPGSSLRRRVAYSVAIVRLVLIPVIFLAVYYLFRMGLIVDRIVSVDAPVARLAEQASVEMLDARRAERNYFLLRDPEYLKVNRESLARAKQAVEKIRDLAPGEQSATQQALENVTLYGQQLFSRKLDNHAAAPSTILPTISSSFIVHFACLRRWALA